MKMIRNVVVVMLKGKPLFTITTQVKREILPRDLARAVKHYFIHSRETKDVKVELKAKETVNIEVTVDGSETLILSWVFVENVIL